MAWRLRGQSSIEKIVIRPIAFNCIDARPLVRVLLFWFCEYNIFLEFRLFIADCKVVREESYVYCERGTSENEFSHTFLRFLKDRNFSGRFEIQRKYYV